MIVEFIVNDVPSTSKHSVSIDAVTVNALAIGLSGNRLHGVYTRLQNVRSTS